MMAGRLSNPQYTQLSEAISGLNMEIIAQRYFDIDAEKIVSIKQDNFYKTAPSNRDMLQRWANRNENSGPNQTKVSTHARTHTHTHTHTLLCRTKRNCHCVKVT